MVLVIIYHIYTSTLQQPFFCYNLRAIQCLYYYFYLPFFQKNSFLDWKQADLWVRTDTGFTRGGAAKEMSMPTLPGRKFGNLERTSSGRSGMLTHPKWFFSFLNSVTSLKYHQDTGIKSFYIRIFWAYMECWHKVRYFPLSLVVLKLICLLSVSVTILKKPINLN